MSGRASPASFYGDYNQGDDQFALNVVAGISGRIADLHMNDNEDMCTSALAYSSSASEQIAEHLKATKKPERKKSDFFQKPLTAEQTRNQALRFGIESSNEASRRSSASWGLFNITSDPKDYENVTDPDILSAPICDVCIVQAKTPAPPGFYRIHRTPSNKKADLNTSSGGNPLYLCIKKDLSGTLYPITNFIVVFPDRNEYTPPGFAVVNRGRTACNLNSGTNAERIFLCYRKESAGNPVIDLQIILPTKGESSPASFNLLEKSMSGVPANLNTGTGGDAVFLTYRQKMARLACLLHEPSSCEEEAQQLHSRLRLRRHTLRSFDDAEKAVLGTDRPLSGRSESTPGSTLSHTPKSDRAMSLAMQPVAINTLTGQNAQLRLRSLSNASSLHSPSHQRSSGSLMEAAVSTATKADTSPMAGHGALPQSMLYSMPQQSLPPPGHHRGSSNPLQQGQGIARSTNSSPAMGNGLLAAADKPRTLQGLNVALSVSFSETVCDSPTHSFDPAAERGLSPTGHSSLPGFPHSFPSGSLSQSISMEGLEEVGRDRASTNSTSATGAPNDTVTNDSDSRAGGGGIMVDRADSDMPSLAGSRTTVLSAGRRGTAYPDYDQPFENMVGEDDDDAEYAQEMAYLLEQMQQNRRVEVVDSTGLVPPLVRRKALLAILSALYIRQGTAANAALAGLSDLLRDSKFFALDLQRLPAPGSTTMLDLTVEAVCDRCELSADGERDALLKFLGLVTPYCGSTLSLHSLQKIFSAVAFLCNHYAITQPSLLEASLGTFTLDADNFDDYDMKNTGMPSFKLLAQLITDTFEKIEAEEVADHLPCPHGVGGLDLDDSCSVTSSSVGLQCSTQGSVASLNSLGMALQSPVQTCVREVVEDFVSEVLDGLEVSRLTEVALLTMSKQSYSTISPPFWKELHALANSLFEGHGYRSAFILLGAMCKQAWHNVRTKNDGEPVTRDVGVKLVALGTLEQFFLLAGEQLRSSKIFGQQVRRIVIPCLLYNVSFAFMDHRIFSKLLRIISALWRNWRRHVRMEFAILCEQFIFKVLQATVVQVKPIFKMITIQEVTKWFEQPHLLLEMFVNYDMDRKFVSHWNTFSYLVRTFCAIGRRVILSSKVAEEVAAAVETDLSAVAGGDLVERSVTIRDVHMQALEEVARIAKTLMDASGHAYLILQDSGFRSKSIARDGGWAEDDETGSSYTKSPTPSVRLPNGAQGMEDGEHSPGGTSVSGEKSGTDQTGSPQPDQVPAPGRRRIGSIKLKREAHQESEALIKRAIEIYNAKNDLKKAVDFLIKNQFLANTPQEIANFLRLYKNSFDPGAIGEFLGEGGKTPVEEEYWSNIRFRYTRAVSFVEMDIEPALRLYLTGCGFRMPGEAQKINRFVEVFVKAFWQDNSGTENCPFKKEDTVHLLAYAIILLNTDLNNVNLDKKGKKRQRMSKEDFFKQLRKCDDGNDIDRDYLSRIYDNIAAQAIELVVKSPAAKNTEDTAVSNPQYYSAAGVSAETRAQEERKFIREMCSSLRDSEDLLRSLSRFSYQFVETKISMDLVSFMFESVWFHFHATAEALLNAESTDIFVKITALDILSHALTCSIFLDLKVERMTLAGLLNDFRIVCESLPYASNVQRSPKIPDNSWFQDVENAFPATALETISKLHHLFVYLKDILQENEHYENTRQVADKFEKKARIMEQNLYFIRQGELSKLSRGKRATVYSFFLFSDQLIYAHLSRGQFIVHEQLSLLDLAVTDVPTDLSQCSFHIEHPVKSFQVTADSPAAKLSWVHDISQAATSCRKRHQLKRGSANDGRRLSMLGRIESQRAAQERSFVYKAEGEATPMSSPPPAAHPSAHSMHTGSSSGSNHDIAATSRSPFQTQPSVTTTPLPPPPPAQSSAALNGRTHGAGKQPSGSRNLFASLDTEAAIDSSRQGLLS